MNKAGVKVGSRVRVKDTAWPNDRRLHGGIVFVVLEVGPFSVIVDSQGMSSNISGTFHFSDGTYDLVVEKDRCQFCDALTPGRDTCCDCKEDK
jgi:hypothetical protein